MNQSISDNNGHCECGASQFQIKGEPITRFKCHCTICQEFTQKGYSDVTLFRADQVEVIAGESIEYKKYKSPPAVDRGKCKQCDKPALEFLHLPLMPSIAIVPSYNIAELSKVPEQWFHVFYHRRLQDAEDGFEKVSGFFKSQLAILKSVMPKLFSKK